MVYFLARLFEEKSRAIVVGHVQMNSLLSANKNVAGKILSVFHALLLLIHSLAI
jgi:hypothetical protein